MANLAQNSLDMGEQGSETLLVLVKSQLHDASFRLWHEAIPVLD